MGRNYLRLPVHENRDSELKKLKENLENIGIVNPTYDEVMGILLEKNKRTIMTSKDIKELIGNLRGVTL